MQDHDTWNLVVNTTVRNWWIVHTQPIQISSNEARIPPTAVGGLFIPSLGKCHSKRPAKYIPNLGGHELHRLRSVEFPHDGFAVLVGCV